MPHKTTGRFLGLPYDWRRPTVARLKERAWNPRDRRALTPLFFGVGYMINGATVARWLRLRR